MKLLKKTGNILVSVLLWAVILLAALFTFTTLAQKDEVNVSSFAGVSPLTVKTDSMAPTFEAGDLIFVRKVDTSTLKVGDIVCFHTIINNEYALNTHRISDIVEENGVITYVTKGDNNMIEDSERITGGDVVGKYFGKLSGFGKVIDFLSGSIGFLLVIVLPMLIFFIYQIYHLIVISIQLKKAIAIEANEEAMKESEDAKTAMDEARKALEEAKRMKEEAEEALRKAKEAEQKSASANKEQKED